MTKPKKSNIWGTTYAGTADFETAARAVVTALDAADMRCSTTRIGDDHLVIHGEYQGAWHVVLLRAGPQRTEWHIERTGERLRITSDFRLFPWYAAVVGLLWITIGCCFALEYLIDERRWLGGARGWTLPSAVALLLAVVLMPVVIRLLGALGGRSGERLWHGILHEIKSKGGRLEPLGNVTLRHSLPLICFFVYVLALIVWFVMRGLSGMRLSLLEAAFNFVLLSLIVILVGGIALMVGRRGFNLRTYPILTGLMSMLAAFLFFQSALLPSWMASTADPRVLRGLLRPFGWLSLGVSLLIAAASCYIFLYYAVYSTPLVRPQLTRILSHRATGAYRLAAGGASPLPFQIVFLLSWLLLTGLSLASLTYLVACAVQGVFPFSSRRELQLVSLSAGAFSAAFGAAPGSRLVPLLTRGIWLLYALAALGLLAASAGQLFTGRRAVHRRLAAAADQPFLKRRELESMLEELRRTAGLPPIRLALCGDRVQRANSEIFVGRRVERYIEISTGCLTLTTGELRALLAHECAHHYLGHLVVKSFALWLGRLSFTGDGFAFALQDSFGNETQADHAAVKLLGADRDDLIRLLHIERGGGLELKPLISRDRSWTETWRSAFQSFLSQYCGRSFELYYWHPDDEERIDALRRLT